jgi:hypothetical protein
MTNIIASSDISMLLVGEEEERRESTDNLMRLECLA